MTSLFWKPIVGSCNCRTTKQMTFLESWDKTRQGTHVFKGKFWFQNVTFLTWTWPDLRSNVKLSVIIEFYVPNGPYNMCHTTLVLFFHAVTSFNLIMTWSVLNISLLFTWHLCHPFSSIFAEFALAAVSGLVSAADKAKRVSLDLWPDLDPTFDLAKKILRLH